MKVDEEGFRGMGYVCCGPRMSHGREPFNNRYSVDPDGPDLVRGKNGMD